MVVLKSCKALGVIILLVLPNLSLQNAEVGKDCKQEIKDEKVVRSHCTYSADHIYHRVESTCSEATQQYCKELEKFGYNFDKCQDLWLDKNPCDKKKIEADLIEECISVKENLCIHDQHPLRHMRRLSIKDICKGAPTIRDLNCEEFLLPIIYPHESPRKTSTNDKGTGTPLPVHNWSQTMCDKVIHPLATDDSGVTPGKEVFCGNVESAVRDSCLVAVKSVCSLESLTVVMDFLIPVCWQLLPEVFCNDHISHSLF